MSTLPSVCSARTVCCALVVLVLAGGAVSPRAASAQQGDRRAEYTIRIVKDQDACFYEIQDYPDQDVFRITPGGFVDFVVTNTDAKIEVKNAADDTPGVAGDASIKIKQGNPTRRMTARGPKNQSTEHEVEINCCNDFLGLFCTGSTRAIPRPNEGLGLLREGSSGPELPGGPRPGEPDPDLPRRADGPTMKVDEDG